MIDDQIEIERRGGWGGELSWHGGDGSVADVRPREREGERVREM